MCIAILNKSTLLEKEVFINSFENNPDGIGIAYSDGKQIQTVKRMDKPEELYNFYCKVRAKIDTPIMIHARIGTSGGKTLKNVHPFKVNKDLALMHNGVISYPLIHKDESDTLHFVRFVQALKDPETVLNEASLEYGFLEDLIGFGSKFIFLHTDGRYSIINESKGHWDDDNDTWYSNDAYKECNYVWYGNHKVYKGSYYADSDYQFGSVYSDKKGKTSAAKNAPKESKKLGYFAEMERDIVEYYDYRGQKFNELSDDDISDIINEILSWFGDSITGTYYTALKQLHEYTFVEAIPSELKEAKK